MRPEHGGRVVMDLRKVDADGVDYDVVVHDPRLQYRGAAAVRRGDGVVTFSGWTPADPPAWLVDLARAFLRAAWNARRRPDPPSWPRRINRWRKERGEL